MPLDANMIGSQVGAAMGLWTHTPVDWRGNETGVAPPGPGGWPANAAVAVPPNGSPAGALGAEVAISAVSVSSITATGATINFTLSGPANYIIDYGTTAAYGTQATGSGNGAQSKAIAGLTTVTVYHYRITATPAGGIATSTSDATFTTV